MRKIQSSISLKSVTNSDVKFLFDLLKERNPRVNISHKKMPTYNQHRKFIKSKQKIGSIYLSKNDEIGIFLSKKFQGKNVGNFALNELMKKNPRKRFLANVSPKNKKSMEFFKKNGFKLIQYTFEKSGS